MSHESTSVKIKLVLINFQKGINLLNSPNNIESSFISRCFHSNSICHFFLNISVNIFFLNLQIISFSLFNIVYVLFIICNFESSFISNSGFHFTSLSFLKKLICFLGEINIAVKIPINIHNIILEMKIIKFSVPPMLTHKYIKNHTININVKAESNHLIT
jgi:hypothetical protein